jgi:hypothetical protein
MTSRFLDLATTPAVTAEQVRYYGSARSTADAPQRDVFGAEEREFIGTRDSFYMATVTETGWPYVQHRGGPAGFLRVLGPHTLGFADVRGNRQMLSTGNLQVNDRVALLLMDYPQRSRLKILGHARVVPAADDPVFAAKLAMPGSAPAERVVLIEIEGFDWNCPKYITPRYTMNEIEALTAPLKKRIGELEAQLDART